MGGGDVFGVNCFVQRAEASAGWERHPQPLGRKVGYPQKMINANGTRGSGSSLPQLASRTASLPIRGVSSRLLRLERPDLTRRYWKGVLWSPSYFAASCGGAPIGILKVYIEQQKTATVTGAYIPALKGEVLRPHG